MQAQFQHTVQHLRAQEDLASKCQVNPVQGTYKSTVKPLFWGFCVVGFGFGA